jgi:hypothetical protein
VVVFNRLVLNQDDDLTLTYGRDFPMKLIESVPNESYNQWGLLMKLCILGDHRLDEVVRNTVAKKSVRLSAPREQIGIRHFVPDSVSEMRFDGTPEILRGIQFGA